MGHRLAVDDLGVLSHRRLVGHVNRLKARRWKHRGRRRDVHAMLVEMMRHAGRMVRMMRVRVMMVMLMLLMLLMLMLLMLVLMLVLLLMVLMLMLMVLLLRVHVMWHLVCRRRLRYDRPDVLEVER